MAKVESVVRQLTAAGVSVGSPLYMSPEQIQHNATTYAEQAYSVLDREKTLIRYNAEWLSKLTFAELIKLASNFTIQQFIARENFKLRWEDGTLPSALPRATPSGCTSSFTR